MSIRLIDANAFAESTMAKIIDGYLYNQCNLTVGFAVSLMPTVEPEVRRGRWIEHGGGFVVTCSSCNTTYNKDVLQSLSPYAEHLTRHCPYCGADMREEGADNG